MEKGNRGGARPNAGRAQGRETTGSKMISIRLDNDLISYLNSQENKNRFINKLIRREKEGV